jgi:CzcA family heavy metal efflux pump
MFSWIIGSSLKFRFLVVVFAAGLMAYGATQFRKMPVDVFPEFAAPTVEVQTEAIGLSAEEVESMVTLNLEELLSGVPWLSSVRSQSVTGLSSIVLTFNRGTDLIKARQMIQERLTLAYTLPNVAQPPAILQPLSSTSRFMMVGLSSDTVEETELSLLARWTIKPKLMGVPGVANVAVWGQRLRQMQVQFDPERLREASLIQEDVVSAAGDALWATPLTFLRGSAPGTGGWVDNKNQRLGLLHDMPIRTPEQMAKVAMTPQHLLLTGKTMALGDVTELTFGHPLLIGDAYVNKGKGLMLVIEKLPSANTLETTKGVETALAELSLGLPGVKIDSTVFRLASYIEDAFGNLTSAILMGAFLMMLVIGAFLFNARSAVVSLIAVPLSLSAAVIVLHFMGATMNTMILAGLALSLTIIVDDSIVNMERLMGQLGSRKRGGATPASSNEPISNIIYQTAIKTQRTALYATLILVLAVMPIFFMGGVSGAFFEPLAISYLLAVAASMIVGLTVTPALQLILLEKESDGIGESPISAWFRTRFEAALEGVVRSPRPAFMAVGALIVAGVGLWMFLGQSLLPSLKERTVLVDWATSPGTSRQETYRITSRVSEELQSIPGIANVGAHMGRAITGDQIVGVNEGQIWVDIDPAADYESTLAVIRETVAGYPGVEGNVRSYLRDNVSSALSGEASPVVVRIFGQKREVLRDQAEAVRGALADIKGLVDLRVVGQMEEPQIRVQVDLERAGKLSVKPGDVRRSAATVFSGLTVGYLFEEQKIHDVVVWGAPETRQNLSQVSDVLIDRTDRNRVRLGDVADVSMISTPTMVRHENIAPYIDVVAGVDGRDLGAINQEIEGRLKTVAFPLEYHPKVMGEYIEQEEVKKRMRGFIIAAIVGIFLLSQACFQSFRLASISFLVIPAAIAGGLLAVFITGGVISMGSVVGLLAVLGIAARNSITLISHYQEIQRQEGAPFGLSLILRGTRERMSAILASAFSIIGVLLPMIIFGSGPGLEILRPTAIVIIGGLIVSTLVTLFVIPALYWFVGPGPEQEPDFDFTKTAT